MYLPIVRLEVLQYLNKPTKKSNRRLLIVDFHNHQIIDPGIPDLTNPPTTTLSDYLSELRREFDWSGCSFGPSAS